MIHATGVNHQLEPLWSSEHLRRQPPSFWSRSLPAAAAAAASCHLPPRAAAQRHSGTGCTEADMYRYVCMTVKALRSSSTNDPGALWLPLSPLRPSQVAPASLRHGSRQSCLALAPPPPSSRSTRFRPASCRTASLRSSIGGNSQESTVPFLAQYHWHSSRQSLVRLDPGLALWLGSPSPSAPPPAPAARARCISPALPPYLRTRIRAVLR